MTPKGLFKLMAPMMTMTGRRNLRATAAALQRHLEETLRGRLTNSELSGAAASLGC
jgi:hypothetical protein